MRLLALFALTSLCLAEDWPRFRGADGSASSATATVPVAWSDTQNIAWKAPLPGAGASSPVIVGDRVFLTAYTGYGIDPDDPGERGDLRLHVLSVNRGTGELQWNESFEASPDEQKATRRVIDHGYATGTPVADGDAVYAYFGVSGLVAFTHTGKKLWHARTGSRTAGFGSAASPIVHGDLVIVNASIECGSVIAFDKGSGNEAWRIDGVQRSWTTPIVAITPKGNPELIISYKEVVKGFNPRTGEELWRCDGIQDYVVPCVIAHEGIAYVLGGRKNQSMAIRLGGRGDVTDTHRIWSTNIGANVTSPVYHKGHLYWASDRGIAVCLDASSGEVVYRERLPTRQRVYASTLLVGDVLYHSMRDKGVLVVRTGPEHEIVAHNVLEGDASPINASPAAVGSQLFLRTNRFLYCISGD